MSIQFYDPVRDQVFVMPERMRNIGAYHFEPNVQLATNGEGLPVLSARGIAIWKWERVWHEDQKWWLQTFMPRGTGGVICTTVNSVKKTTIWDEVSGSAIEVAYMVILRPTSGERSGGWFPNFQLTFTNILLAGS